MLFDILITGVCKLLTPTVNVFFFLFYPASCLCNFQFLGQGESSCCCWAYSTRQNMINALLSVRPGLHQCAEVLIMQSNPLAYRHLHSKNANNRMICKGNSFDDLCCVCSKSDGSSWLVSHFWEKTIIPRKLWLGKRLQRFQIIEFN